MKRALNLSAWTQALVFLVLFLVGRWLVAWSYAAVKVSCPPPPPHERQAYHVAGCVGHECLGLDILVKDATPLPGSLSDSNSAFEGYHQQHHDHTVTPGNETDMICRHFFIALACPRYCYSKQACLLDKRHLVATCAEHLALQLQNATKR